jgi:hypothetical protein
VKRGEKAVKLLEAKRRPAAGSFDEEAGKREELVVAWGLE